MKDGYNGLLEVIGDTARGTQGQAIYTGIVRSVSPLTVETGGVLLSGGDLLVNSQLLLQSNAKTIGNIKGNIKGQCDGCDQGGDVTFTMREGAATATITQGSTLTAGCRVALVTADRDKFIVLCKVVTV